MKLTMTQAQLGIYLTSQEPADERNYDMALLYDLGRRSEEELRRFARAAERTILAHPALLMSITHDDNGIPCFEPQEHPQVQVNVEEAASREEVLDLISETGTDGQKHVQSLNLIDRLWVCRLFQTPEGAFFFCSIHHILFDALSYQLFLERLAKAFETDQAPTTEAYSLVDLCLREQEARHSPAYQDELDWYMQHFAVDEFSRFPGLPQSKAKLSDFRKESFPLDVPSEKINEACARYDVGKSALFHGAFAYLLAAYNYSEEASYATVFHGRTDPRLAQTTAMITRTLPVYVKMGRDETVQEYLSSIQAQTKEVRRRDAVSSIDLNKKLGWQYRFMFTYEGSLSLCPLILDGKEMPVSDLRVQRSGIDLSLDIIKHPEGYVLEVLYPRSALSSESIRALAGYYNTILSALLEKEHIRDVEILTAAQRSEVIRASKGRHLDLDITRTAASLISENARTTPDVLAVDDDTEKLTYAELEHRANVIARRLLEKQVQPDDFVGILLERGASFPVCALGIQKAGAAYLPLDLEYPVERLRYMAEDSQIRVLITTREILHSKQEEDGFQVEHCLFFEELDFNEPAAPVDLSKPEGNAYMIYTSGSTGLPKGVVLHHAGLMNLCASLVDALELTPSDRIASHSSFSFDAHVDEVYPVLTAGGSLHIMPSGIRKDTNAILGFLKRHQIHGADFTTSLGMLLARHSNLDMRFMTFGGEKLSGVVSDKVQFFNEYGPTESTDIACIFRMERGRQYDDIPIGEPMPNLWCFVLDRFGHLLPPEIPGELCVAGIQVGRGYWRQSEMTAEVFQDCPFVEQDDWGRKVRMYHTGDLALRGTDGQLYCIGRINSQVKLNGFRVELGEIEARALELPGFREAAAKVWKAAGGAHLALYYVIKDSLNLNKSEVKSAMKSTSLPAYMVPELYMKLDALPRTPSGKVDRNNLPMPEYEVETEIVLPRTDDERTLWEIAKGILGTDQFGVTTDLPQIGLSSLDAMILLFSAVEHNIKIEFSDIMKYRTIESILKHYQSDLCFWFDGTYDSDKPILVFLPALTPAQRFEPILSEIDKYFSVLVIEPMFDHYASILQDKTIQDAINLYLNQIASKIPENVPVFGFMGNSYGGELAYKLAVQWAKWRGEKPRAYILDSAINRYDAKKYDQYVQEMLERLKDNPTVLEEYQMLRFYIDIPHKLGNGEPFPTYDGPVVYFVATHITDDVDFLTVRHILAIKTEDHPHVIAWRKLNPQTEFVFIPTVHRKMYDARWVPTYMKYLLRDLKAERDRNAE